MKARPLGTTGLVVSEVGFGAWGIGGLSAGATSYGPSDDEESKRALRLASELGVTFFDTADSYNEGHSEQLLGKLLRNRRQQIIICTKAGHYQGIYQAVIRQTKPYLQSILRTSTFAHKSAVSAGTRFSGKQNFDPKYIVKS